MRNDPKPPFSRNDVTTHAMAKKNREGLAKRPDYRAALRAGYHDALAGLSWHVKWTLGDDMIQDAYARGRHMGALARAKPIPWPERVLWSVRLQSLLSRIWEYGKGG